MVDFIDTHLNANDTRNGIITACQNDYAMVGTFVLFLSNVDDEINCTDQAGAKTGIPDLASVATGVPQACSPVAFPVSPHGPRLRDQGHKPQTYTATSSRLKYLQKTRKTTSTGRWWCRVTRRTPSAAAPCSSTPRSRRGSRPIRQVAVGGRDPQSAYTPIVNQMKTDGSNYSYNTSSARSAILLRSEAQLQGLKPKSCGRAPSPATTRRSRSRPT